MHLEAQPESSYHRAQKNLAEEEKKKKVWSLWRYICQDTEFLKIVSKANLATQFSFSLIKEITWIGLSDFSQKDDM